MIDVSNQIILEKGIFWNSYKMIKVNEENKEYNGPLVGDKHLAHQYA